MTLTLPLGELLGLVTFAVLLAATDAARLSRLLMAWLAKKLDVDPREIEATTDATNPEGEHGEG